MDHAPLTRILDGAPLAAPAVLDRCSERWWSLPPRARFAVVGFASLVALAAGTAHLLTSPWGAPVTVLVARHDLGIGHQVGPADVRRADWPAELVPDGAVLDVGDAAGTILAAVPAGSILTDRHLGDGGLGTAVPVGRAAIALPIDLLPPLPAGATIDLVGADLDRRGVPLASGATVLAADGVHVWVVVDHGEAADAAAAALAGTLTAVVVPP
jgi:pilus assembly protein CpaB